VEKKLQQYYSKKLADQGEKDAVQSVKLLTNGYGDFNGQALVAFRLRGHRTKALAIRAPFVGSQQMRTWNPSSTPTPGSELVVLDLPPGTKESHLFDYYKVIPELSSIRLTMNRGYKTFVGKAVVGFSSKQGCMKAWNLGPVKVAGKQSRRWVKGRLEGKELFLKGSTKLTDEVVMERYKSLGPDAIIGITWHTKGQTDVHSGQGIVAFRTDKEMEQALAMGGFKVDEDAITVEKPTPLPAAASKGADFMET
jgi:hypothetical protein